MVLFFALHILTIIGVGMHINECEMYTECNQLQNARELWELQIKKYKANNQMDYYRI